MFLEEHNLPNPQVPLIPCQRVSHFSKRIESPVNLLHHNIESQANISFNYMQTPIKNCDDEKSNVYELQFLFQKSNICHTARKTSTPINSDEPLHVNSPLIPREPNMYSEDIFFDMSNHTLQDNSPAVTFKPLSSNFRQFPNILNVNDLEQLNAATKDVKFIPIYPKNNCANSKKMLDLSVTLNRNPIIEQYVSSAIESQKTCNFKNIKQEKSAGREPSHRKVKNMANSSLRILGSSYNKNLRKQKFKNFPYPSEVIREKDKSSASMPIKLEVEEFSENMEIKMEPMTCEALEKVLSYEENHCFMKIDALGRVVVKKEVTSPCYKENSADFEGFEEKDFVIRKNLSNVFNMSDIFEDDKLEIDNNFDVSNKITAKIVEHEVTFTSLKNNCTFSDLEKNSLGIRDRNEKKECFLNCDYETFMDCHPFNRNEDYLNGWEGSKYENGVEQNYQPNQELLCFSDQMHIKEANSKNLGVVPNFVIKSPFNVSDMTSSQSLKDSNSLICIDLDSPSEPSAKNNQCYLVDDNVPEITARKFSFSEEVTFEKSWAQSKVTNDTRKIESFDVNGECNDDIKVIEKSSFPSKYIYQSGGISMQKVEVENSLKVKDFGSEVSIKHIKDNYGGNHILSSNGVTLRRVCGSSPEVGPSDKGVIFKIVPQSNRLFPELDISSEISSDSSWSPDKSSNCSSISQQQSKSIRIGDIWPRNDLEGFSNLKAKNSFRLSSNSSNFNDSLPSFSDIYDNLETTQSKAKKDMQLFKKPRIDCNSFEDLSNNNTNPQSETFDSNISIKKVTEPSDPFLRKFNDQLLPAKENMPSSNKTIKENSLRLVRIRDNPTKEPFKSLVKTIVDSNSLKFKSDCDKENNSTGHISFRVIEFAKNSANYQTSSVKKSTYSKYRISNSGYFSEVKKGLSKRYICPLCIFVATRKKDYFAHFITYHMEDDIYICTVCSFKEINKYKFNKHLNEHLSTIYRSFKLYEENRFLNCNVCKFSSILATDFFIHKATHIPKDSFNSCSKCHMSYKMKEILEIHQCFLKEKSLRREINNYRYKKQVVDNDMKNLGPFECRYCPYANSNRKDVILHELIHADPQSFVCHYCNEDAGSLIKLADHLETHKKEQSVDVDNKKNFSCYICDTIFADSSELKSHLISHTVDFERYRVKPKEYSSASLNTKSNFPQVEIRPETITMEISFVSNENMVLNPKSNYVASEEKVELRSIRKFDNISNDDHSLLAKDNEISNTILGNEKETICELVKDNKKEISKLIQERKVKDLKNVEGELNIVNRSYISHSQNKIENIIPTNEKIHERIQSSEIKCHSEGSPNEASDRLSLNEITVLNNNSEKTKTNDINKKVMEHDQAIQSTASEFEININTAIGTSSDQFMLNIGSNCDRSESLGSKHDFTNVSSEGSLKAQRDCSGIDVHINANDVATDQFNIPPIKKMETIVTSLSVSPSSENNLLNIDDLQTHTLKTNLENHLIEKVLSCNYIVENIEPKRVCNESELIENEAKIKNKYPLGVVKVEPSEKQYDSDETKTHACLLGVVFEESSEINEKADIVLNSSVLLCPSTDPSKICQLNKLSEIITDNVRLSDIKESLNVDKQFRFSFNKQVSAETDDGPMSCNFLKHSDQISNSNSITNNFCQEELKLKNDPSLINSRRTVLPDLNNGKSSPSKSSLITKDEDSDSLKVANLAYDLNDRCAGHNLEICKPSSDASSSPSTSKQFHDFDKVKDKKDFHPCSEKCLTQNSNIKSSSPKSVLNKMGCFSKTSTYASSHSSLNKVEKSKTISDKHHKRTLERSREPFLKENKNSKSNQPTTLKTSEGSQMINDTACFNIESAIRKTVHKLALKHINEDISKIIGKNEGEVPLFRYEGKLGKKNSKFKKHSSFDGLKDTSFDKAGSSRSKSGICSPKVLYSDKKKLDINKLGSNGAKGQQEIVKKEHHEDSHSRKKKKKSHYKQSENKGQHFMTTCSDEMKKSRVEKNKIASSSYYAKQQEFISSLFNKKPLLKMGRIPKKKQNSSPHKEDTKESENLTKVDKLSNFCKPVSDEQNSEIFYYVSVAENKTATNEELICSYKFKKECDSKEQTQVKYHDYPLEVEMKCKTTGSSTSEFSLLQKEESSNVEQSKSNLGLTYANMAHSLGSQDKEKNISNEESVKTSFVQEDNIKFVTSELVTTSNLSKDFCDVTGVFCDNLQQSQKVEEFQSYCEPVRNATEIKLNEWSMRILPTLSRDIKLQLVEKEFLSAEVNENLPNDIFTEVEDIKVVTEFDTQVSEIIKDEDTLDKVSSVNDNYSSEIWCPSPVQIVSPDLVISESIVDQQESDCLIKENDVDLGLYDYIDKEVEALINKNRDQF